MTTSSLLSQTVDEATRLVDGIKPDQLGAPTPCEEFTVQQLIDHMVGGTAAFAAGVSGTDASATTWKDAGQQMVAAFEMPGALDGTITLPWGAFPGDAVLAMAIMETATHAADLARATGQSIEDDAAFTAALEVAKGAITDEWRRPGVFGPEQTAPAGASAADRLLAFAGRKI